jgi:addiction module HigA family antidote
MKLPQRQFAARLGWTTAKLNELIRGKRGITAESALDLAAILGTTPELWLNLQMYFHLIATAGIVRRTPAKNRVRCCARSVQKTRSRTASP